MKTRALAIALLALLLLSGCDKLFDGLIETVYKDQIEKGQFGSANVDVTIRLGTEWAAQKAMGQIKLALVPYFSVTSGVMPDWSKRIAKELDWNNVQYNSQYAVDELKSTITVPMGFSYRLFVWQSLHATDSIGADEPSKSFSFYFRNAWGSNDMLDQGNIGSDPYAEDFLFVADRISQGLLDQLNGQSGSAESLYVEGPSSVDTANLASPQVFYAYRYGGANLKPVTKLLYQIQRPGPTSPIPLYQDTMAWMEIPLGSAYSGQYSFSMNFAGPLNENGTGTYTIIPGVSLMVEVRLQYADGSQALSYTQNVSFFTSGTGQIASGVPFLIDISVGASGDVGFGSYNYWAYVYNEYGNLTAICGPYPLSGGTGAEGDIVGGPRYSASEGGQYSVYIYVDANASGSVDSGDIYSSQVAMIYTTDPQASGSYIGTLSFNDPSSSWWSVY